MNDTDRYPLPPSERRRTLALMEEAAARLDHNAELARNAPHAAQAKHGDEWKAQARAIRWALRELDPECEPVRVLARGYDRAIGRALDQLMAGPARDVAE